MIRSIGAVGLPACLFLAACGGGGGSDGAVNSVLAPPTTAQGDSQSFSAVAARQPASGAPTGTAFGTVSVRYNPTANTYTVADAGTGTTSVFLNADQRETTGGFARFATTANGGDDSLVLLRATANPTFTLTYTNYGLWSQRGTGTGAATVTRAFLFGQQTSYGEVPRTGSASYDGIADGYWTSGGTRYRLSGSTGSILANFATGEIATAMNVRGAVDTGSAQPSGPTATLGAVAGRGSITGGTNLFTGTLAGGGYSGGFEGAFFGPAAAEAGMSFHLSGGAAGDGVVGVLVGKPTPAPAP